MFLSVALADTQGIFLHGFAPNSTTSNSAMGEWRIQKRGCIWSCFGFFNARWQCSRSRERQDLGISEARRRKLYWGCLMTYSDLQLRLWTPGKKRRGRKSRLKLLEAGKYIWEIWKRHWGKRIGESNMKETEPERWNERGKRKIEFRKWKKTVWPNRDEIWQSRVHEIENRKRSEQAFSQTGKNMGCCFLY